MYSRYLEEDFVHHQYCLFAHIRAIARHELHNVRDEISRKVGGADVSEAVDGKTDWVNSCVSICTFAPADASVFVLLY